MKIAISILLGLTCLLAGVVIGGFAPGLLSRSRNESTDSNFKEDPRPKTEIKIQSPSDTLPEKERELGKLYPSRLALRVLMDLRVLSVLESNGVPTARKLLQQDLDINASSLAVLAQELQLDTFETSAINQARAYFARTNSP